MKYNVLLSSILFALLFVLGIATIKGNSGNKLDAKNSYDSLTKAEKVILDKVPVLNIIEKKDIYNDGSSIDEIAEATKNIEYDFASSAIRPIYYNKLNKLAKIIVDDKYVLSLRGHADSVGSYKPNWMLSDKRAIKVKDYLVSKGVDEANVVTVPFGSTIPIAPNTTAAGRQKNRRVEIKLKKVDQ